MGLTQTDSSDPTGGSISVLLGYLDLFQRGKCIKEVGQDVNFFTKENTSEVKWYLIIPPSAHKIKRIFFQDFGVYVIIKYKWIQL